eukprot:CAMPEP_0115516616 /NCGR_PEP_ID=MMETSP0271-20121206/76866_1 /TAXON_ID=71861 /ORGANISM="Scrippsiella trochoidea, Strain CCMP3099" /LENGTH=90 /DNA_ID=CAMNT_0002947309 /DNA_START=955 /DNA_END=1223 /DNA_ORIENTATION=-
MYVPHVSDSASKASLAAFATSPEPAASGICKKESALTKPADINRASAPAQASTFAILSLLQFTLRNFCSSGFSAMLDNNFVSTCTAFAAA